MTVSIRPFSVEDIQLKVRWINDPENNGFLHYDLPLRVDKTREWFERVNANADRYDATIELDGQAVGLAGLLNISKNNAEVYFLVGERYARGRDVALSAVRQLLERAFKHLGLSSVHGWTESGNTAGQRVLERAGFSRTGLYPSEMTNRSSLISRFLYVISRPVYASTVPVVTDLLAATPITRSRIKLGRRKLFIKRDDLYPFSLGGNKARKAQQFSAAILADNYDSVVTYGSIESNHCRVIANICSELGLPCTIISPLGDEEVPTNRILVTLMGARVVSVPLDRVRTVIDATMREKRDVGAKPFFIPGGGHHWLGVKAYVQCFHELVLQEEALNCRFDPIYVANGTGSTLAGLVAGDRLLGTGRTIRGVSIARSADRARQTVLEALNAFAEEVSVPKFSPDDISVTDRFTLGGYGKTDDAVKRVILDELSRDGVLLDPIYTGKAFWGMLEELQGNFDSDRTPLFVHTGSAPLALDYMRKVATD